MCARDSDVLAGALEAAQYHAGPTAGRAEIRHLDRSVVAQRVIAVYEEVIRRAARGYAMTQSARKGGIVSGPDKVLMVLENDVAPLDTRVWEEALALRNHGYQVNIICPKGVSGRAIFEEYRAPHEWREGIHIYRYGLPDGDSSAAYVREYLIALLCTFWLSLKVLIRHGFDVIHVANPPDIFFPLGWFYRLLGKKFVFDQHDLAPELFEEVFDGRMYGPMTKGLHWLMHWCERRTYRAADLVIVPNKSFRRMAMTRGGRAADRVVVVRNDPNLGRVHRVHPEPELKMGRRYLLAYVGVMGRQDGVDYALLALNSLVHRRGRRDVALALLGGGSQLDALRALTHRLQLDEYVHFHGWSARQDVLRYLTVADVALCPDPCNALNDASTMVKTMEYMAMGLPTVAFDLTETRFSAQEAALYAPPNQVEVFADQIETLLDDETLRLRMGASGRRRVEEELNWEHSSQHLIHAYQHLLRRVSSSDTSPSLPADSDMRTAAPLHT